MASQMGNSAAFIALMRLAFVCLSHRSVNLFVMIATTLFVIEVAF